MFNDCQHSGHTLQLVENSSWLTVLEAAMHVHQQKMLQLFANQAIFRLKARAPAAAKSANLVKLSSDGYFQLPE